MKNHNRTSNAGGERDFWVVVCALHDMLAENEQVNEETVARRLRTSREQAEEWLDLFQRLLEENGHPEAIRYNEQRDSYEYASDDAAIAVYEDIVKPIMPVWAREHAKPKEMWSIDDLVGRSDTQGIVRQWFFIYMMLLKGEQVNASVVAKLFRISERTAARRIAELEGLLGKGSMRYNRKGASFELVARNPKAETLLISLVSPDFESSYKALIGSEMENESLNSAKSRPELLLKDEHYGFEPPQKALIREEVACWLEQAIKNSRKVEIEYYSPSGQTVETCVISPYELRYVHGLWYCVAFCERRKTGYAFELHNIHSVKYRDETFKFEGFNADAFVNRTLREQGLIEFDRGHYEIKIRFTKEAARMIRGRVYHETQTLMTLDGGDLLFMAKVRDLDVIKRWVMTFIPNVVSIEPVALRDAVLRDLKNLKLS